VCSLCFVLHSHCALSVCSHCSITVLSVCSHCVLTVLSLCYVSHWLRNTLTLTWLCHFIVSISSTEGGWLDGDLTSNLLCQTLFFFQSPFWGVGRLTFFLNASQARSADDFSRPRCCSGLWLNFTLTVLTHCSSRGQWRSEFPIIPEVCIRNEVPSSDDIAGINSTVTLSVLSCALTVLSLCSSCSHYCPLSGTLTVTPLTTCSQCALTVFSLCSLSLLTLHCALSLCSHCALTVLALSALTVPSHCALTVHCALTFILSHCVHRCCFLSLALRCYAPLISSL
jgi:hypothetical protein